MQLKPNDKKSLLKAALGEIPSDLLIKNVQLVNVITGEIYPANVYVYEGFIAHVESDNLEADLDGAKEVIDGKGQYLIPGFIDAHVHIESSMMTPRNFAKAVIPKGTTTIITDPHEIANVWGVAGVEYMYDSSEDLPMRQLIDIPSCVPSVPGLENAGATFSAKEVEQLAPKERIIGLAEVMDYIGVINGEERMMEMIEVAEKHGLYLQGHAPFLKGRELSAYLCGGPNTCHESRDSDEALAKLRNGMHVDARNSSIARNVKEIWEGVKDVTFFDNFGFCTDDREADDILNVGHINDVVRYGIARGMDPVAAIKSATFNSAREAGIEKLGAIAPGYVADMILLDDLRELKPNQVFFEGKLVAKDDQLTVAIKEETYPLETKNSVHMKELSVEDFKLKAPAGKEKVVVNLMKYPNPAQSYTEWVKEELPVVDGCVSLMGDQDLKFVAVVNRYAGNDNIAIGVVRGFGTNCGALASTISHDSHNLTIVYEDPAEALLAAKELLHCHGGMSAVKEGQVLHTLELPLAGLMSLLPAEELSLESAKMKEANRALGLEHLPNPLLRIVTLALPVIPTVKMSDMGLINVIKKEFIPIIEE